MPTTIIQRGEFKVATMKISESIQSRHDSMNFDSARETQTHLSSTNSYDC